MRMGKFEVTQGIRHHPKSICEGDVHGCPFHKPSLHAMIEEPMLLRETGLIERICPHGIGHPDPDSIGWMDRHGRPGYGVHGCDGCCRLPDHPGRRRAGTGDGDDGSGD